MTSVDSILRDHPWRLAGTVGYAVVLLVAAVVPAPSGPDVSDLTLHGTAYAVQAALLLWLLGGRPPLKAALVAVAATTLLGLATELAQALTVHRHAELRDLAADAAGAALVAGIWLAVRSVAARRR